jgi:hypothetical protein
LSSIRTRHDASINAQVLEKTPMGLSYERMHSKKMKVTTGDIKKLCHLFSLEGEGIH